MRSAALAFSASLILACGSSSGPGSDLDGGSGSADGDVTAPDADVPAPDAAVPPADPEVALEWWDAIGGDGADWGGGVAVDGAGNVYLTAGFSETVTIGDETLESHGSVDVAIVKYLPNGEVDWVKHFGSEGQDEGQSVAFQPDGNLLVAGSFEADMQVGTTLLESDGQADIYLMELTPSGDVEWAKRYGGEGHDYPIDVAVRGSTIAITGGYGDPGANFGGDDLPGSQYGSLYVLALDEDGVHDWSVGFGAEGVDQGLGVAIDSAGRVVVAGAFSETVDFGDGVDREARHRDMVVARYASPGTPDLVRTYGGSYYDAFYDVAVDADDHVYLAGHFRADVTFGDFMLSSTDGGSSLAGDAVLLKLSAGGQVLWAQPMGSPGNDRLAALTLDTAGRPVVAGNLEGEIDLGSGLLEGDDEDFFFARFDKDGDHLFSTRVAGAGYGEAKDIAINPAGHIAAATDSYGALTIDGEETPYADGYDTFVLTFLPLEDE